MASCHVFAPQRSGRKKKAKKTLGSLTSKGSLTAGDDDSSDAAVDLEGIQGLSHLPHQPVTQSVKSLGSVQLDETHVTILTAFFHQNILILTTCRQREPTQRVRLDFCALKGFCRVQLFVTFQYHI